MGRQKIYLFDLSYFCMNIAFFGLKMQKQRFCRFTFKKQKNKITAGKSNFIKIII